MRTTKWILLSLLLFTFSFKMPAKEIVITEIPPSGIVINSPGTYVFGNDIKWSPSGSGQAIYMAVK